MRRSAALMLITVLGALAVPAAEHLPDMERYRKPLVAEIEFPSPAKAAPTNVYANAVQLAYPELGVARIGDDPKLFDELAALLRSMRVRLMRFPGGTWCHCYSIHGPETMDALRAVRKDYILDRSKYQWTDTRVFLKLCRAVGSDALYQLNVSHWVDPATMTAYRIAPHDSSLRSKEEKTALKATPRDLEYAPEKTALAVQDAQQVARWAKEAGVKVLWEFGNEDYTMFSPETYLKQCKAFYDAIKEVDRRAAFVITADGYSWSDWRWGQAVIAGMAEAGLRDIAHLSCHVYMTGGCRVKPVDGETAFRGLIGSWYELRFLHHRLRKQLQELGRGDIQVAITEGNMIGPGTPIIGKPYEHGMGRALAEAAIFPARIQSYSMLVHHDLVRSDKATWFCRVFYAPDAPPGERYLLPTDGEVMRIAGQHALNQIVHADIYELLTASVGKDGILLTVGNPVAEPRQVSLQLTGVPAPARVLEAQSIVAENLDSPQYTREDLGCKVEGDTLRLELPPFSYSYLRLAGRGK